MVVRAEEIQQFGRSVWPGLGLLTTLGALRACRMGNRPCCRSCRHCVPPVGAEPGWCRLRRLPIHVELANELWCHHWTGRPPALPLGAERRKVEPGHHNRQLALADLLES
jgi:hypothetical protein